MIDIPDASFLLPGATTLVEAAVFLVVLFVVSRWVLPRIQAAVEQRRRLVEDALAEAAAARAAAEDRQQEADDALRHARLQARDIIDLAYERHDFLVEEGKRKGREEYDWFTRSIPRPTDATTSLAGAANGSLASTSAGT
jgi:F-type H+-transporting ATPase subunit b